MATEELDIFTSLTIILFAITTPHTYPNIEISFISEGLFVNNTKYSKQKHIFPYALTPQFVYRMKISAEKF